MRRIPFYSYPADSVPSSFLSDKYTFHIYATAGFESRYKTRVPMLASISVACAFLLVVGALAGYENFVRKRDNKVTIAAAVTGGIVSSLFPSSIRTMMFDHTCDDRTEFTHRGSPWSEESRPIACLFPDTTILYADIAGFTAWSSSRPPEQVFILLETIFRRFDRIAHRLGVYKVETIGDCYVAVTGLPDPQPLHAVIMTEFAVECLQQIKQVIKKIGQKLGAGTQDLSMRFGLHSGPVTAGVLRGDRSRFQLFGETVNIASHIEHTGVRDRIHVSSATAGYLIDAGKGSWLRRRADSVMAEGGGWIQTYWIEMEDGDSVRKGGHDLC
jgi:class 3 adenylate cyclase